VNQQEMDARLVENYRLGAARLIDTGPAEDLREIAEFIEAEGTLDDPARSLSGPFMKAASEMLHEAKRLRWLLDPPDTRNPRDSALEGVMLHALIFAVEILAERPVEYETCRSWPAGSPQMHRAWLREDDRDPRDVVGVCPQHHVGRYRVDYLVTGYRNQPTKVTRVAVEIDGHDFHERTKEQAARDKKRDRFMQGEGLIVLRFAGSEVWADPVGCAAQAVRMALGQKGEAE
jgi:very-short-patch-repair endonuclease